MCAKCAPLAEKNNENTFLNQVDANNDLCTETLWAVRPTLLSHSAQTEQCRFNQ